MTESPQTPRSHGDRSSMIANVLAIAGSIILIVIIIWGLIHLISISGGAFSSLFGANKLTVSAPTEVVSGQQVKISWKHSAKETGMYAIMYPCTTGLAFSMPAPDGKFITMPCGAAFAVGTATTSTTILPMLTSTTSIKTPLSVLFIPSSTSSKPTEATVTMTVKPVVVQTPVAPTTPTTPTQPTTPKPTQGPTGLGDLSVTITSVSIDGYGNGTVMFNVSNVGTGMSGSYSFTAQLPTAQPYTYVSPVQTSLAPGSYIVNTLRFTQAAPGNVYVVVDPSNAVNETSEGNNTATQYVTGTYPYNYEYNQPYIQQYNYYSPQPVYPNYYDIYNYPYVNYTY